MQQRISREAERDLYETEFVAGFAVSPIEDGLVAHVNWVNPEYIRNWQDVLQIVQEIRLLPCFFDGAFDFLVEADGWPPAAMTRAVYTPDLLRAWAS